jgi:DNA-directed RNA polymerase subunit alpha
MTTATLPRSAQILTGTQRPTLAQIRLLRRISVQDVEEHRKLAAVLQDGLSGVKDDAKVRKGILAFALGHFSDAEEAVDGTEAYNQALIGLIYHELGEFADAKTHFAAASKSMPEAKIEVVRALLDGDQFDDAEKALGNVPESADRDFLTGRLNEGKNNTEAAINSYESALEKDPEHVEAAFHIGVLLDRIGDDDMAMEYYMVCADVHPHYVPGITNLGILYEERGESNAAIDCFRQVLAYNPRDRRALLLLRDAKSSRNMYYDEREERERERMEKIMRTPVNDFELSVRSRNCLSKMNIFTLGDLLRISEQEMLSYKNFGETSLKEVKEMLAARNLRLGMYREGEERSITKADQKVLAESIEKLELGNKNLQMLEGLGVSRIGDLAQYTDLDLFKAPLSGQTIVQELSTALGAFGVSLPKPEIKS